MTGATKSKWSAWRKAVLAHLGIVGLSFLLSVLIVPRIVPFDPEGMFAVYAVFAVLFGHAVAAVVSLFIRRTNIWSCGIVFVVAFFFTGCFSVNAMQDWAYLRYQAAYDRFRDNLASPIPRSVSNLRLVSLKEQIRPDLMLEFNIDPADMDAILKTRKLEQVDPNNMLNPKDFLLSTRFFSLVGGVFQVFFRSENPPPPKIPGPRVQNSKIGRSWGGTSHTSGSSHQPGLITMPWSTKDDCLESLSLERSLRQ